LGELLHISNVEGGSSFLPTRPSLNIKHHQAVFAQGAVALPFQVDVMRIAVADARGHSVLFQVDGVTFKDKSSRPGGFVKFHNQHGTLTIRKSCFHNIFISAAVNQYANGAQKRGSLKIPRHFQCRNFHMADY